MEFFIRIMARIHAGLYRLSGGWLGAQAGKQSILLLHTTGRKSGKSYTTPLAYFRDGGDYLIVASNWGKDRNPGWYHNLIHQSQTTIQVKSRTLSVEARQAEPNEYMKLWKLVTDQNEQYLHYQEQTPRQIPIVILTPIS
jgi:deazaflavin-dependent oxidoreductase (nitroreductase family)